MIARGFLTVVSLAALLTSALPVPVGAADVSSDATPALAEPAVSPDHSEIAFVSGGAIWSVPSAGGTAHLLAVARGNAHRPIFSPDGKHLAFVDSTPGSNGIYVLTLDGGALRRLTHDDQVGDVSGWSGDGRYVYFAAASHNISYFNDVYRVAVDGGTPMVVLHEDYVNEFEPAPSSDGTSIAFVRNGFLQWWRRSHSHMDESEIVVAHPGAQRFDTITTGDAKDQWPMWSPDDRTLYYVSDRSGSDELWSHASDGHARQLTSLRGGRVLWPTISHDGRMIAFERGMHLWTYDVAAGAARELPVVLRGLPDVLTQYHLTMANRFTGLSLSPDGKKIAFVARGRVFAASAAEGGSAQAVTTHENAADDLPVWAPDSRRIAYVADRGTEQALMTYDFPDGPEHAITPAGHHDDYPHWSPDGTSIAFVRDGRELHLWNVVSHADRVLATGIMDRRPFGDQSDVAFSPGGDWIAYVDSERGYANAMVVHTSGGPARAVTFLPNTNAGSVTWSPDGTRLFMGTSQRTEDGQVAQVDLQPRAPRFREDTFRSLFQEPTRPELPSRTIPTPAPSGAPSPMPSASAAARPAHPRTTEIDFTGIRDRLTFLPTGLDIGRISVTPDSKTLVLVANAAGETNLYAYSVDDTSDEPRVAKQLTSTPGFKTDVAIEPNGHGAVYLDSGRIWEVDLTGKGAKPLAVSAELDADFAHDKRLVFDQAWSLLDRWYADPNFHGTNWGAMRTEYEPYALAARTPQEFGRIVSLMIGELNSSHSGFNVPRPPAPLVTGRLGVDWDAAEYDRTGRLRIASIVPLGPVAIAGHVAVGDEVLAVDGTPVDRSVDVDALLANTIGKRTELRIAPHGDAAAAHTVVVLPGDRASDEHLRYLAWVAGRRAYVERISGGRVGYVHIPDMGSDSLAKFYTDLDVQNRERAAVIVDVRNNTGGFVDPYAIDVVTRREFLSFKSRFGNDAPERTQLGQRALDRPTALVVNEHSLSDSENFTEAYRELHAGPVVGVPTAGWIIFTSGVSLYDGSVLRLPTTRVIAHDGVDMELHPRGVDVRAELPPGALERGDDPQLDAAVRELLKHTGAKR